MLIQHFLLYLLLLLLSCGQVLNLLYADLKKEKAGNVIENQAGTELIAAKQGEITIAGVKIATMIVSVTEIETALATMIQEVIGDHVHGQENGQGIMIATGSNFFH